MLDRILSLIENGYSYDEVANELGVTKGVVAGALFRYRNPPKVKPKARKQKTAPSDPGPAIGVPLDQLQGHHCRWPVGHTGVLATFCGRPRRVKSWCAEHSTQGHQP